MSSAHRILIVEPDRRLGKVYAKALSLRGYIVDLQATAQDAVLAADAAKPDMVLLELQLTSHSGIEFLYEFRSYSDWTAIPVVVVSGVPQNELAASHKLLGQLGVVDYQYKPQTSLQAILHVVENVLAVAS